jgi:hypothetical protein
MAGVLTKTKEEETPVKMAQGHTTPTVEPLGEYRLGSRVQGAITGAADYAREKLPVLGALQQKDPVAQPYAGATGEEAVRQFTGQEPVAKGVAATGILQGGADPVTGLPPKTLDIAGQTGVLGQNEGAAGTPGVQFPGAPGTTSPVDPKVLDIATQAVKNGTGGGAPAAAPAANPAMQMREWMANRNLMNKGFQSRIGAAQAADPYEAWEGFPQANIQPPEHRTRMYGEEIEAQVVGEMLRNQEFIPPNVLKNNLRVAKEFMDEYGMDPFVMYEQLYGQQIASPMAGLTGGQPGGEGIVGAGMETRAMLEQGFEGQLPAAEGEYGRFPESNYYTYSGRELPSTMDGGVKSPAGATASSSTSVTEGGRGKDKGRSVSTTGTQEHLEQRHPNIPVEGREASMTRTTIDERTGKERRPLPGGPEEFGKTARAVHEETGRRETEAAKRTSEGADRTSRETVAGTKASTPKKTTGKTQVEKREDWVAKRYGNPNAPETSIEKLRKQAKDVYPDDPDTAPPPDEDEGEDFAADATPEEMEWAQKKVETRGVTLYPSREGGKLVLKNAKGVILHTFGE